MANDTHIGAPQRRVSSWIQKGQQGKDANAVSVEKHFTPKQKAAWDKVGESMAELLFILQHPEAG